MRKLEWDSDFFQREIFRIDLAETDFDVSDKGKLFSEFAAMQNQIIYVFLPLNINQDLSEEQLCEKFEYHRLELQSVTGRSVRGADIKVEFQLELESRPLFSEKQVSDVNVISVKPPVGFSSFQRDSFESLAWLAGHKSRFNNAPFSAVDCRRMYTRWLDNSLNGELADYIFYTGGNNPDSLLTLIIDNNVASIGLLAVSSENSGKGTGKRLMKECIDLCLDKGIAKLTVPTQLANEGACAFYRKCGFTPKNYIAIYHIYN